MMDDAFAAPQFGPLSQPVPPIAPARESAAAAPVSPPKRIYRSPSARQSGALLFLLLFFIMLLFGPFLVGRFVYETKYNELKAGYDVATGTLEHLKSRLNDLELASQLVAKRVEPSVVSITRPISRSFTGREFDGQGSGVIIDKAGYIITNFHVVDGVQSVQV